MFQFTRLSLLECVLGALLSPCWENWIFIFLSRSEIESHGIHSIHWSRLQYSWRSCFSEKFVSEDTGFSMCASREGSWKKTCSLTFAHADSDSSDSFNFTQIYSDSYGFAQIQSDTPNLTRSYSDSVHLVRSHTVAIKYTQILLVTQQILAASFRSI